MESLKLLIIRISSFIQKAVEANFLKPRKTDDTAVLLTFNLSETPYNIWIHGEPADKSMYNDKSSPWSVKSFLYTFTPKNYTDKKMPEMRRRIPSSRLHKWTLISQLWRRPLSRSSGCQDKKNWISIMEVKSSYKVGKRALQLLAENYKKNPEAIL